MTQVLGAFINGEFYGAKSGFVVVVEKPTPEPEPEPIKEPSREVTVRASTSSHVVEPKASASTLPATEYSPHVSSEATIDRIVALLAEVTRLAQTLDPDDQRRTRDFAHAAVSVLNATTILPQSDQQKFQSALKRR